MPVHEIQEQKLVPENIYRAKVLRVKASDGEYGPCEQWIFEVQGKRESAELLLTVSVPRVMSPSVKMARYYAAITGRSVEIGQSINTDDIVGKFCRVNVKQVVRKDNSRGNKIEDVLPAEDAGGDGDDEAPF